MHQIWKNKWEKIGLILKPNHEIYWMKSHTSSPFVVNDKGKLSFFFTARDSQNRSRIGQGNLSINGSTVIVESISKDPIIELGESGSFDESGTSYPCIVDEYLFYTGWKIKDEIPFENNLGVAKRNIKLFEKLSNKPIIKKDKFNQFGVGSVFILKEEKFHMWYTSFINWDTTKLPKHFYNIKYACSKDGINWEIDNLTSIDFSYDNEFAICRPSIIKFNNRYHMVFCHRGDKYSLGYAYSEDKLNWVRDDKALKLNKSVTGFDSEEMSYPFWFIYDESIYLFYCGNNYGNSGIGVARLKLN